MSSYIRKNCIATACHALLSWALTVEVFKTVTLEAEGVCHATSPSEAAGINKPLVCDPAVFSVVSSHELQFLDLKVFEINVSFLLINN